MRPQLGLVRRFRLIRVSGEMRADLGKPVPSLFSQAREAFRLWLNNRRDMRFNRPKPQGGNK